MAGRVVALAVTAVLLAVALPCPAAHATAYQVGDSAGWTTVDEDKYKQWAATKTFRLGDVIVFVYTKFHNVMRVTHEDYNACNKSSPIATYTSGNDSITITKHGHHFYMCGFLNHCQLGQKVDINVPTTTAGPIPAPLPSVRSPAAFAPAKAADSAIASGSSSAAASSVPVEGVLNIAATALVAVSICLTVNSWCLLIHVYTMNMLYL